MNPEEKSVGVCEMKKHVQSYGQPDDRKAWLALGGSFLYEVLAIALIHLDQRLLGWTLHSLNMVRFFIQFHDMAHFSFFSSIPLNRFFGKLIGIYTHFPFEGWRDGHNHHHKHFGNLDRLDLSQTILFTKKQYEEMKGIRKILTRILREPIVFFTISLPFVWFIGLIYVTAKRYGVLSLTFFEKVMSVVGFSFILPYFGIPAFEMWLSVYIAQMIGTILFHLQHSVNLPYRARKGTWDFTKAALEGSTFLDVPFLLRPFTNGIEYHHIHHLNTNIASYVIGTCHETFDNQNKKGNNWDNFNINRVHLDLAFRSMFNVMLDEETGLLVPFSYGF